MSTEHAHDDAQIGREGTVATREAPAGSHDTAASKAAGSKSLSRFSPATVSSLQRSAGSRAVAQALGTAGLAVQRHSEGEELPAVEEQKAEVDEKKAVSMTPPPAPPTPPAGQTAGPAETAPNETAPATPAPAQEEQPAPSASGESTPARPSATRTAEEEKTQKEAATKSGAEYEKAVKLTPSAQSLAGAQSVLQGQYGGLKTIVTGTIEILADQPACSAKYDEVCIRDGVKRDDGSDWKPGDCAKDDAAAGVTTEGFAWKGVIYVNGKTTLVTATVHEMLHNNTVAGFRAKVGETFNEGTTEFLARKALKASGVTVPATTAYPDQIKLTELLIALVGEDVLTKAYFDGVDPLVTKFTENGSKTWAELVAAAEALDTVKVTEACKKKPYEPTEI